MAKPDQPSRAERQSGQRRRRGRSGTPSAFVPVWEGDSEAQASVVAGSLQADGIRAVINGSQPIPSTASHAFARNTWAVLVPGNRAADARALLRETADAGVVEGGGPAAPEQLATLKFAVFGLLVVAAIVLWQTIQNS